MTEPLTPAQIEEKLLEENAKDIEQAASEYLGKENALTLIKNELLRLKSDIDFIIKDYYKKREVEDQKDSLELIFQKQSDLLKYLNQSKPDNYYNGPERYPFEKVMHMMTAMSDEFSEVRAGLKWKHWKSYEDGSNSTGGEDDSAPNLPDLKATQEQIIKDSNIAYLRKEWIDILHFWVQGAQELGLDSKKTLELYLDKNKENHTRQDEGY